MSKILRIDSIKTIDDVKGVLQQIQEQFDSSVFDRGEFKFFKITFTQAQSNLRYPHKLVFSPTDVIQLSCIGDGEVTWNYSLFDKTNLDLTSTGACVVRAYIGRHKEGVLS